MGRIHIGDKNGRLTIVKELQDEKYPSFLCKCDCGKLVKITKGNFRAGATKSCGCYKKEKMTVHGKRRTPEFNVWCKMKQRCYDPNSKDYHNYGGRGIEVCERWKENFMNFYEDMGQRPSDKHSIDRVDVNGDYSPDNCRWVTRLVQSRNQRERKKNKIGCRGVYWEKDRNKYRVRIRVDGREISIGRYDEKSEAIKAREEAERKYWKESC